MVGPAGGAAAVGVAVGAAKAWPEAASDSSVANADAAVQQRSVEPSLRGTPEPRSCVGDSPRGTVAVFRTVGWSYGIVNVPCDKDARTKDQAKSDLGTKSACKACELVHFDATLTQL